MSEVDKTREQLLAELTEMHQRVAELEARLDRSQTKEMFKRRANQLELINKIGRQVTATLDLDIVLDRAACLIQESFGYQHVGLFVVDDEQSELVMRARAGSYARLYPSDHRLQWGRGMIGWVAQHGRMLLANDVSVEAHFYNPFPEEIILSELSVPIRMGERVVGVLDVSSQQLDAFDENDVMVMETLADQLAIAIENTRLYQSLAEYNASLEQAVEERTEALRYSTERIEAILNNSSDVIILAHTDGSMTQVNPAFDTLFRYAEDEFFQQPLTSIVHADYVDMLSETLRAVVEEEQIKRLEVLARRKDNSTFFAEIGVSFFKGRGNRHDSIVCNLRDITERKRAEEELLKALERERELSDLKTRFVSMTSHEFRTPLTTIVSSAELLERHIDKMSPAQKGKHFDKIQTAARRMTRLLDDVLIVGKADTGRMQVNPTRFDLKALCQAVLEEVQLSAGSNIQFSLVIKSQRTTVVMDETLLRQVLTNLLTNAVKYSPQGGTVHIELHCGDGQTSIRIADEGIGIPQSDQERLFEPFHRARNVSSISGSGLGLAITKRAVALHGGSIHFESQVGIGTTFTITLPTTTLLEERNDEDPRD
jgi:PAS domain S-box-containing protein